MRKQISHTELTGAYVPISSLEKRDVSYVYWLEKTGKIIVFETIFPGMKSKRLFIGRAAIDQALANRRDSNKPAEPARPITTENSNDVQFHGIYKNLETLHEQMNTLNTKINIMCDRLYKIHKRVFALCEDLNITIDKED